MPKKESCKRQIAHAARERFSHFGYCKTTMSEIAEDCKMSPGNLYRYFAGKIDIAEEIADEHAQAILDRARGVVRDPNLSAVEKLHKFLFDSMKNTFDVLADDPRIFEIAEIISKERPEYGNRHLKKERGLIVEILSTGNASGIFNIPDVMYVAEMIQSATYKFKYAQLHSHLSYEQLERELEGVFQLLMGGLCVEPADTSLAS
jgi:AcrR family transcriptional regulator